MANSRRSFIQKFLTVTTGSVIASKSVLSNTKKMKESSIKKIKPLGFQWETQDPFLFCVHHEDYFPKGNENMGPNKDLLKGRNIGQDFIVKDGWRMYHGKEIPGFPGHPHRGFETVTVVRKGMVDHSDSMGAAGRYGDGDVQWMTAGKGILHSEMFPLIHQDKDNTLELFQIWLNLPKSSKMTEPHFKMMWKEDTPIHIQKDENGNEVKIEIFAGKIGDLRAPTPPPSSWAANPTNHVAIWNIKMDAGTKYTLPKVSKEVNRTIYFYKGDALKIDGETLKEYHSADVVSDKNLTLESGETPCDILILQGKPIGEPVVQHGPFVMNTKEEIQQTFQEYQQTQFGGWPWERLDHTHPRDKGRFAKHADGKIEVKS